ncbi:MAG: hypothetical protein RL151_946 [Bacteroidota bacterium]
MLQRLFFAVSLLIWMGVHIRILGISGMEPIHIWREVLIHYGLLVPVGWTIVMILRYLSPTRRRLATFIFILMSLWLAWIIILQWMKAALIPSAAPIPLPWNDAGWLIMAFSGGVWLGLIMMVNIIIRMDAMRREDALEREASVRRHIEAELMYLRAQLNPHFLFNSLNGIHALIGRDARKAREMTISLAEFLRGSLRPDVKEWSSFEEEMMQVERYLAMERWRFGDQLKTNISVDENTAGARIPALLIQPLLENSIKYGFDESTGVSEIQLDARLTESILQISVKNSCTNHSYPSGTGFGLTYVERRMYLLFGRSGLVRREQHEHHHTVHLNIPQPA